VNNVIHSIVFHTSGGTVTVTTLQHPTHLDQRKTA
jgi:hypothetical protein